MQTTLNLVFTRLGTKESFLKFQLNKAKTLKFFLHHSDSTVSRSVFFPLWETHRPGLGVYENRKYYLNSFVFLLSLCFKLLHGNFINNFFLGLLWTKIMEYMREVLINIKILEKFFCELKIIVSNYSPDSHVLGIKYVIKL